MLKRINFNDFINKKARDGRKHLHIIRDVLSKGGLKVADYTEKFTDDPYIFLYTTEPNLSFQGVRIYNIGDGIAFRIQREEKTHPYGKAYALRITDMFNDLVEDMDQEKAGHKVMEYIVKEMQKFFASSAKADNELNIFKIQGSNDPINRIVIQSSGVDISRQVGNSI
jgi:hypothetical protein